jgi:hypothetical protein
MIEGGCLCGGVRFAARGALRPIIACHCGQCRKQTGTYVAATASAAADLDVVRDESLAWYSSSEEAERGFCTRCGSGLFWRRKGAEMISIFAGALEGATGLSIEKHIYVADKPDWYDIHDGKPQDPQWTP